MSEGLPSKTSTKSGSKSWMLPLCYVLMIFVLSWPSWLNGQAFFLQDTTAYIKGAASGIALVSKSTTAQEWLHPTHTTPQTAESTEVVTPTNKENPTAAEDYSSSPEKKGVLAGRSIYYGVYLFVITAISSINIVPVVTSLLSIITIFTVSRSIGLSQGKTIVLLAVLAIASPLPFFNSMLMPDIFAGLAILSTSAFLFLTPPHSRYSYFWSAITLCAVLFHTANILIISGLLVIAIIVALFSKPERSSLLRKAGMIFLIVLVGIAGEVFFNAAVKHFTHNAPIRPPFLSARLVADGPGKEFAENYCASAKFEICRYQPVLGKGSSDDFLWSLNENIGVFTLATKSSRELLSHQDSAFAFAVLEKYPTKVIRSTVGNFFKQLSMAGLEEFNYPALMISDFSEKIPEADFERLKKSKAGNDTFPLQTSEFLILAGVLISLLIFAYYGRFYNRTQPVFWLSVGVIGGFIINALICGALSTPHDRYQARVIWLIPLIAFYIYAMHNSRQDCSGEIQA